MANKKYFTYQSGKAVPDTEFDKDAFVNKDGSVAMEADLDLDGNKIANLAAATLIDDAVTNKQLKNVPIFAGIEYYIQYVKSNAGAPSGTATEGEKCLNTNEKKVYTYTGGSWVSLTDFDPNERAIFATDGTDTSGDSGTNARTKKIYTNIGGIIDEFDPPIGSLAPMVQNIPDQELNIYVFLPTYEWGNLVQPDPPTFSPVQILPDDFSGEKEIWNLLDTWLKKAVVVVKTAFDNGAQITLGFDGDEEAICSAYDVDLTTVGVYAIPDIYRQSTADELLKAFLTASSTPTSGLAFVFIEQS